MQVKEIRELEVFFKSRDNWSEKMQRNRIAEAGSIKWLLVALIIGSGSCASAEDDVGKIQYQSSCAACHGAGAKGDGPVAKELKTRPPDLTVLAKNNNGVFPYSRVYQTIDGRDSTVPSHGTREMPIWGYRFGPTQAYRFKARVVAVIDYLKSIQEK